MPFCRTKCGYCDFYSVPVDNQPVRRMLDAIAQELTARIRDLPARPATCHIGGGTPTIVGLPDLERFLNQVRSVWGSGDLGEFTVEANPTSLTRDKASLLAEAGVNRVCLGAQSFHRAELEFLDRRHDPQDVRPAIEALRDAGIGNIGLDLIFGIGGQTLESWSESLRWAVALQPTHISCYGLTYERGTPLAERLRQGTIERCSEDLEAQMYLTAIDTLGGSGFEHYEISNFAQPGFRSQHNMIYWTHEPFLGVGPSAAGYIDGVRYKNIAEVAAYIERVETQGRATASSESLQETALAAEMLMLRLRLVEGFSLDVVQDRTGVDLSAVCRDALRRLRTHGLIEVALPRIRLTRRGLLVADGVIRELAGELEE